MATLTLAFTLNFSAGSFPLWCYSSTREERLASDQGSVGTVERQSTYMLFSYYLRKSKAALAKDISISKPLQ